MCVCVYCVCVTNEREGEKEREGDRLSLMGEYTTSPLLLSPSPSLLDERPSKDAAARRSLTWLTHIDTYIIIASERASERANEPSRVP